MSFDYIELQRTPCFGSCPDYKLTLFENGNAIIKGSGFITKKEKIRFTVSKDAVSHIFSTSDSIHFFSFPNNIDDTCVIDITDNSETVISIKRFSRQMTVREQNCALIFEDYLPFLQARYSEAELDSVIMQNEKAKNYLNAFHELASEIDSIANSEQILEKLLKQ